MARPSEYQESFIKIAEDYIASCGREATELPTIEGLALSIGVDDETIGLWAEKHPEFSATIKDLKAKQKNQLVNDGLYGGKDINATMAIFLLKANHGLKETDRHEIGGEFHADGSSEPIRLFVNAGQGFLPATVSLPSTSTTRTAGDSGTVQSTDLASESSKDIHGDNGSSQTGTS